MTFHVDLYKVMTKVTGQWAHPRTRSQQSFNHRLYIEPWLKVPSAKSCSDSGIFAWGGGGGGGVGSRLTVRKQLFLFGLQHCDFPGGPDPLLPSGSALDFILDPAEHETYPAHKC